VTLFYLLDCIAQSSAKRNLEDVLAVLYEITEEVLVECLQQERGEILKAIRKVGCCVRVPDIVNVAS
jgi:hypothetical protein